MKTDVEILDEIDNLIKDYNLKNGKEPEIILFGESAYFKFKTYLQKYCDFEGEERKLFGSTDIIKYKIYDVVVNRLADRHGGQVSEAGDIVRVLGC